MKEAQAAHRVNRVQGTAGLIPTAANRRATASYSSSVMPGLP